MSDNIKTQAFNWFLANPYVTLKMVASQFDVEYETVRDWAKTESWVTKRVLEQNADPSEEVTDQARGIRNVLYEAILSGEADAQDLAELVRSWKSLVPIRASKNDETVVDRDSLL